MNSLIFTFILSFSLKTWAQNRVQDQLILGLGETTSLVIQRQSRIVIQNGHILKIQDFGSRLQITGKRIGQALLKSGSHETEILILSRSLKDKWTNLIPFLQRLPHLAATIKNQQIEVTGTVYSFEDWLGLAKIFQKEDSFSMMATMKGEVQVVAQNFFSHLMKRDRLPVVPIDFIPHPRLLLANPSAGFLTKYKKLLRAYGVEIESNEELINNAPMVRVQITVAEIRKKFSQVLGVQWPESLNGQILNTGHVGISRDQLALKIQALEQEGYGTILANPILLCRSGKEAEFLAGGEVPIKVSTDRKFGVTWKKYGVSLKIKPKADFSGKMRVALETEVSSLDTATLVEGIPSFLTNRIQSHFDLSSSRTIALSGLIKSDQTKSREGLPWISRIPILGALFSSQEFRENKTELVMFVTPSIVDEKNDSIKTQISEFQDI